VSNLHETAGLASQLIHSYREHLAGEAGPEIVAVPGRVLGGDIEDQADALADDAARLAELLTAFAKEPGPRSLDAIAVFQETPARPSPGPGRMFCSCAIPALSAAASARPALPPSRSPGASWPVRRVRRRGPARRARRGRAARRAPR
jgi:hypothetical protein